MRSPEGEQIFPTTFGSVSEKKRKEKRKAMSLNEVQDLWILYNISLQLSD